jgi:palmitoyl-protein thioesterase
MCSNNIIRGYIAKYNDPPVYTFMSICGINAGVGAFPNCSPQSPVIGSACEALTEVLSTLAYTELAQNILFQADYFRDPSKTNTSKYMTLSQLAQWENEGNYQNLTLNENFAITEQYVWVLGTEDTVVWPREGEWWGAMDPNDPWNTVLPMEQVDMMYIYIHNPIIYVVYAHVNLIPRCSFEKTKKV